MKRTITTLTGLFASLFALAANYAFSITMLGPNYLYTSFEADQIAEFDGANKASQLIQYRTPGAILNGIRDDYVYVIYADGKIAKFKMVSPQTPTIRLRFESLVPAVPQDARTPQIITFVGSLNVYDRNDYINGDQTNMVATRELVDVSHWLYIAYEYPADTGSSPGCPRAECSLPILQ